MNGLDPSDIDALPARLTVRVTPNAKQPLIKRELSDEGVLYRIYVTTPPEDGKANKAVIAMIAKAAKWPKSKISIASGHKARSKIVLVEP